MVEALVDRVLPHASSINSHQQPMWEVVIYLPAAPVCTPSPSVWAEPA
jgi:hypothetical protein